MNDPAAIKATNGIPIDQTVQPSDRFLPHSKSFHVFTDLHLQCVTTHEHFECILSLQSTDVFFWQLNWIRVVRGQPNILLTLFITLGNFGLVHFIQQKPSRRSIFLGPTACQASTVQYIRHPVKLIRYVHDRGCTTGCQVESMWECGQRGSVWT